MGSGALSQEAGVEEAELEIERPRLQLSAAECDVFSGMRATYSAGREWHFHQPPIGDFVKNQNQNPILVKLSDLLYYLKFDNTPAISLLLARAHQ